MSSQVSFISKLALESHVLIPSGSHFAGTACGAPCKNQNQFDPSKSSTFVDGGEEATLVFGTGGGVTPVVGDNTALTVRSATDTVSIGGLTVKNTSIFLIINQTEVFESDPYDGIQGWCFPAMSMYC